MNRFECAENGVYKRLLKLVENKEYFVLTTNVDHLFKKSGFNKNRLFYTQGDYGLFQCSKPCHTATYDNEKIIRQMVAMQKKYAYSVRTYSGLSEMRKANDHESANRQQICAGRRLA